MKKEKVIKKKKKNPEVIVRGEPAVKMIEYSIKMVIPTGQYANIQPEIRVTAPNPEMAHDYCAPHMNKMWREYFMVNERRTEVAPTAPVPTSPPPPNTLDTGTSTAPVDPPIIHQSTTSEAPPSSNVAVIKATQAIESCMSLEALDLIKNQVELSVKLTKEEKPALRNKIVERFNELNADNFLKKNGAQTNPS